MFRGTWDEGEHNTNYGIEREQAAPTLAESCCRSLATGRDVHTKWK